MVDDRLVREMAQLSGVILATDSARAAAREATAMLDALRAERQRLRFEHGPRDFERLLRRSGRARA